MSIPNDSPSNINLEQQRKRSKDLLRSHHEGNVEAAVRGLLPTVAKEASEI